MDNSKDLNRLRELAGNASVRKQENKTGNMYEIRQQLMEAAKPDFVDIDGDGDTKEPMKKAAKDKEKTNESDRDVNEFRNRKMNEWANSPANNHDDREHYHEQPPGETVDLSLRRYLNAEPMKVSIEEDIEEEALMLEYAKFKESSEKYKYAAYDSDGNLVGLYKDLETAKKLKPGHTYLRYKKERDI